MDLRIFLLEREWDSPFFKRLAKNDTAEGVGHQAGMVFPKDLRKYLPELPDIGASGSSPTVDRHLRTELYFGATYLGFRKVRYQLQTWGGTRAGESRLTDGLQPIHSRAKAGDILILQRRADVLDYFRMCLISKGTKDFSLVSGWVGDRSWGALETRNEPVTQSEIQEQQQRMLDLSGVPFEIDSSRVRRIESNRERIARSAVFREQVRREYQFECAVSGIKVKTPSGLYEVEAAHVVPLSDGGMDDVRNGLSLCQTLHWAFDHGLFGITPERRVFVPRSVKRVNSYLQQFDGKTISENRTDAFRVHPEAFEWHFQEKVQQW